MSKRRILCLTAVIWAWVGLGPVFPGFAQVLNQVTNTPSSIPGPPALDDAGTVVWSGSSTGQFGDNPRNAFQIARWDAVSGVGQLITHHPDGISPMLSVSDDGQWLAFPASTDLVGKNHDRSIELFVMKADGSSVIQLTNDPAPDAGSVTLVAIAGSGNRIAFVANTNPAGQNEGHLPQLFVINRDGTELRQLTASAQGSFGSIGISDDGTRLAFTHDGILGGPNPSGSTNAFVINFDGTGFKQLTAAPADQNVGSLVISGNGQRLAFQADINPTGNNPNLQDEIFVINFDGTGLKQVTRTSTIIGTPAAQFPSITDDGQTIFYCSNYASLFVNFDSNYEIFRIKADGSGMKALTSSALTAGSLMPTAAGNGGRVAFYALTTFSGGDNPDESPELWVMDGNGGNLRQLSKTSPVLYESATVSSSGRQIVYVQNNRVLGNRELWRIDADGKNPQALTSLSSGQAYTPQIGTNDTMIVFCSDTNQTGSNSDGSEEVFSIDINGGGLRALTNGPKDTSCSNPALARHSNLAAFDCNANLAGGNSDGSREVFVVRTDGSGLLQLTSGPAASVSQHPRISADGRWVVFASNANLQGTNPGGDLSVFRIHSDGSGLERLASFSGRIADYPDLSDDGSIVAFESDADPAGTNPEGNFEIFLWDAGGPAIRQLTTSTVGSSRWPRLNGTGSWAYFVSDAPYFDQIPGQPTDYYRVGTGSALVERISGLRLGSLGGIPLPFASGPQPIGVSQDGQRAVFASLGNLTGQNLDLLPEVFLADMSATPRFQISKSNPTILSWDTLAGPVRYDAIRGDVSRLGFVGAAVDLGPVVCLENDSPDTSTEGFPDSSVPVPGTAFFFLYRGTAGGADPGSWGSSSSGAPRQAGPGGCQP